jgi:hypothetical protein
MVLSYWKSLKPLFPLIEPPKNFAYGPEKVEGNKFQMLFHEKAISDSKTALKQFLESFTESWGSLLNEANGKNKMMEFSL